MINKINFERKNCSIIDDICPLKQDKAEVGNNCYGCSLFEKKLYFKELALAIRKNNK